MWALTFTFRIIVWLDLDTGYRVGFILYSLTVSSKDCCHSHRSQLSTKVN